MPITPRRHPHSQLDNLAPWAFWHCARGSALVAIIIAMSVAATLGTALYSFVSTSSLTQIGSMNDTKAYYLAESGGHYGIKRLGSLNTQGIDLTNRTTLMAAMAEKSYDISNVGQFTLAFPATNHYVALSPGQFQLKFTSTGSISGDASISRTINYIVDMYSFAGTSNLLTNFNSTAGTGNFNANGPAVFDSVTKSIALNNGTGDAQVSLNLYDAGGNPNSTLPNILDIWNKSNNLLTYEAQVKVKLSTTHDVLAGLSFRLNTGGNTNLADDSFYGLSYLWCSGTVLNRDLPTFCGADTSKTYVVLWKQATNGTKTIIGKQLASSVTTGLVSSNALVDWATLVVRLQEQYNLVDSSIRENMIYAFVGIPSTSPKGTIHWDYTKYPTVQWNTAFVGNDCSGGQNAFISDTTFTTANFDISHQDEVGLHALGRAEADMADLSLRFNFNGGIATPCVAAAPGTIKLSASTYQTTEGNGTATITATRSAGSGGAIGVSYATVSGGTATAGSDYTTTSGTLSWANGDTSAKTFTIPILDDAAFELSETVNLAISTPTGGAILGTPNTAVLTISDNDGVMPCDAWPSTALKSGTTSLSSSFATSTCADRLLVCAITSELGSSSSSFSVTGTYGGKSFTTLRSTAGLSTRQHVWLGYVKESGIASRSGDTVSTSISAGSTPTGSDLYCASYKGVDQTYPIAGSRANYNSGSSSISFGGSVAVTNGGYIFYASAANGAKTTPPTGYVEHWDNTLSSYSQASGSKKITATGTEAPSWSLSASDRWGMAVASLNPALGGGSSGTIDFSLATYSVAENIGTATITATRSGGASGAVSVHYATSNGTATASSDYSASAGTLTWADGDVSDKTFTIDILDDLIAEGNETVNLTISTATGGATLGVQDTALLTIVDDEALLPGTIAFSAATYSVAENGGTATITATRSGGSNGVVGVSYATSNGSATSGSDYTAKTGTLSWANGDSANKTFTITILDDSVYEGNETVNLTLSAATGGATLGTPNPAVLTIVDNEVAAPGTIKLSASTYSAKEGTGTVTITATRSSGSGGVVGVNYATTSGGTATAGSDYTATSGTLTWTAGDTANKTFTITIFDDTSVESNETVNLAITTPTGGATLGTPNTAALTIIDNDRVQVCNQWPNTALKSGTTTLSNSFTTTGTCTNRLLVCTVSSELGSSNSSYSVAGDYGGQVFTTLVSTTSKSTQQHVWYGYVKEAAIAARSTDTVSLTVTAGSTPSGSNLYCASYEGVDQTTPIAGSRSNYSSGSSSVSFGGTVNVTNGGYIFYSQAANGTSSGVPSGYTEHWDQALSSYSQAGGSKSITSTGTESPSSWSLNSSERWGLAVGSLNPVAGGVNAGSIAFSSATYSVAENGSTATITAIRSGGTGAVGVSYATSDGTTTAGSDYTTTTGTLSWANGDTAAKTFTIPIIDDSTKEANKTVNLALSNPTGGAALGTPNTAVLTITDNDTVPGAIALSSATYTKNEIAGSVSITATRTGGSDGVVGVSYATSNGTATAGSDYTAASGTLSWADGDSTSKTITITIFDDAVYEGNETVNLTLSAPSGGATLGTPSTAVLTIVDNDVIANGTIALTASTYSVVEQDSSRTVTITATRTGGSNGAVGVSYATSNGTAIAGSDYTAASGTLSWADGVTGSKTFTVTISGDTVAESDETFSLALTNATGSATLGTPNTAVVTIYNDDTKTYYVQPDNTTALGVDGTANVASGSVTTAPFVLTTFDPVGNSGVSSSYRPTTLMLNGRTDVMMKIYTPIYATTAVNISNIAASFAVRGYNSGDKFNVNLYDYNPAGTAGNETVVATGTAKTISTAGSTQQMTWTASDFSINGTGSVAQNHRLLVKLTYRPNGTTYTPRIYYDVTGTGTESTLTVLETPGSEAVAGTIAFSTATYSTDEAGPTATVTATRSGGFTGAVDVSYATSNGTATAGSDYTATSGTLSWSNGDSANKTFTIPITNDTAVEADETVNLALTSPTGGAILGTPNTALLTITDNDGLKGTLALSASTYTVAEDVGTATITVTRSGGSYGVVGVSYATSNGTATAGSDYTATTGTLSWDDGDYADKTFTIPIINDTTYENDETINVAINNTTGGVTLGTPNTAVVTISANDAVPGAIALSTATYSVNENGGTATITATRTGGADGAVGISYATSNGTANSGSDYTSTTGDLSWANADSAAKTFTVAITRDTAVEGNQTFNVTLSSATGGATIGSPSTAVVTIVDETDSTPPTHTGSLTATATSSTQINLSWPTATDSGFGMHATTPYKLVRATSATAPANCSSGTTIYSGTALSYNNTSLTASTQYSYRLCAYDVAGNVTAGLTATATTQAAITHINAWSRIGTATSANTQVTGTAPTVAAGANRLMAITLNWDAGTIFTPNTATINVTCGGTNMTPLVEYANPTSFRVGHYMALLKDADAAFCSGKAVVVGPYGSTDSTDMYLAVYAGVDQTTPVNATGTSSSDTNTLITATFGGNVAVVVNGWIFYALGFDRTTVTNVLGGYSAGWPLTANGTSHSSIGGDKAITALGNENPTFTWTTGSRYGVRAVSLNPAP